jgi:hypothetical protein
MKDASTNPTSLQHPYHQYLVFNSQLIEYAEGVILLIQYLHLLQNGGFEEGHCDRSRHLKQAQ